MVPLYLPYCGTNIHCAVHYQSIDVNIESCYAKTGLCHCHTKRRQCLGRGETKKKGFRGRSLVINMTGYS